MSQNARQKILEPETISSNVQTRPFGFRDKIGYMFGDFGNDFFFILVSSFLMVYYTDVYGISAAFVGILFLVARLWDAIADVTWGRFIDTRKPSKQGKFKPWVFRMSFPLVISGVLILFISLECQPGFMKHMLLLLTSSGELYIVRLIFHTVQWPQS